MRLRSCSTSIIALILGASSAFGAPIKSLRNLRYWASDRLPIRYETDSIGDPRITDGSDYTAIDKAFAAWTSIPGTTITATTDGRHRGLSQAVSGDLRNSITFNDQDGFEPGYLGQAVVTSVTGDTVIAGRLFHAGEIVDADILFNSGAFSFSTPSFPGTRGAYDLRSIATHEVGHVLGLSHSCVGSSTMFWAIPHGDAFASLENDDRALALRNYGKPRLSIAGRVLRSNGVTPLPGAAVLAIGTRGDTLQMTVSRKDGSYDFYGLGSSCRVYVLPIDGGPEVGRLAAASVNDTVAAIARHDFLPEFWDGPAETNADFGSTGFVVQTSTFPVSNANILLNDDITPPHVVSADPGPNATGVPITAAMSVKFDDRIVETGLKEAIKLQPPVDGVEGGAGLLRGDSLLVFTPKQPLLPATEYQFRVGPGIQDRFGNTSAEIFTIHFTTEGQRSLVLEAASPVEIPVGATLTLRGAGFDLDAQKDRVFFGAVETPAAAATVERLYVTVPAGGGSQVHVEAGGAKSNELAVRIVSPRPTPIPNRIGSALLSADPRHLAVGPDGRFAYVATGSGVDVVGANPSIGAEFLRRSSIAIPGGCTGLAATLDGARLIAVGPTEPRLRAFDTAPGNGSVAEASLAEEPLGIEIVPGGGQALIAFASRIVLVDLGVQFGVELRQWSDPNILFQGSLAVSLDARESYASLADGEIAVLGLLAGQGIVRKLPGGTQANEVAAIPAGGVLSVDGIGDVWRAVGPVLSTLPLGGGYSGVAVSPEGSFAYAANFTLNRVDVVDLQRPDLNLATTFAVALDPRDVATAGAGRYVYVISASSRLEVFDTQGELRITSVMPQAGGTGTLITIRGTGFDPTAANNVVEIGGQPQTPLEASPDGSVLLVRQTAAALRGDLRVTVGGKTSNAVPYDVENRPDAGTFSELAGPDVALPSQATLLAMSPNGHLLIVPRIGGELSVLRADAGALDLHREIQHFSAMEAHLITPREIAMTPDGKRLYIVDQVTGLQTYDVDESIVQPVHWNGSVLFTGATSVSVAPDGSTVYVAEAGANLIHGYSTETGVEVMQASALVPQQVAVHPNSKTLYALAMNPDTAEIDFIGLDGSPSGRFNILGSVTSFVLRPDGHRMYVLGSRTTDFHSFVYEYDIDPDSPARHTLLNQVDLGVLNSTGDLLVNHSGTLAYVRKPDDGFAAISLEPFGHVVEVASGADTGGLHASVISQDDARLYGIESRLGFPDELEILALTPVNSVGSPGTELEFAL